MAEGRPCLVLPSIYLHGVTFVGIGNSVEEDDQIQPARFEFEVSAGSRETGLGGEGRLAVRKGSHVRQWGLSL